MKLYKGHKQKLLAKVQLRKQKNKKMMRQEKYTVAYCVAKSWEKNKRILVYSLN